MHRSARIAHPRDPSSIKAPQIVSLVFPTLFSACKLYRYSWGVVYGPHESLRSLYRREISGNQGRAYRLARFWLLWSVQHSAWIDFDLLESWPMRPVNPTKRFGHFYLQFLRCCQCYPRAWRHQPSRHPLRLRDHMSDSVQYPNLCLSSSSLQ